MTSVDGLQRLFLRGIADIDCLAVSIVFLRVYFYWIILLLFLLLCVIEAVLKGPRPSFLKNLMFHVSSTLNIVLNYIPKVFNRLGIPT